MPILWEKSCPAWGKESSTGNNRYANSRKLHPGLYGRIKDEDLIAKEFRYLSHCYRNFTRGEIAYDKKRTYETGDFHAVSEFITTEVVERGRVISLNKIHSVYGLQVDKKKICKPTEKANQCEV
jgi:hypothetical protein